MRSMCFRARVHVDNLKRTNISLVWRRDGIHCENICRLSTRNAHAPKTMSSICDQMRSTGRAPPENRVKFYTRTRCGKSHQILTNDFDRYFRHSALVAFDVARARAKCVNSSNVLCVIYLRLRLCELKLPVRTTLTNHIIIATYLPRPSPPPMY